MQKSGPIKPAKDITIATFNVPNGRYVIIPSTKMPDSFGPFSLKVYLDCTKSDAKLQAVHDPSVKFSFVAEEEETVNTFSDQEKQLFGIRNKYIIQ